MAGRGRRNPAKAAHQSSWAEHRQVTIYPLQNGIFRIGTPVGTSGRSASARLRTFRRQQSPRDFDPFMSEVTIRIPATTANLGPGFDCLGIALQLANRVTVKTASGAEAASI